MKRRLHLKEINSPAAELFGSRFKARRKALGLTQGEIYRRGEIAVGYLLSVDRGRANPTLDMMVRLSAVVSMETWEMLCPADEPVDARLRRL